MKKYYIRTYMNGFIRVSKSIFFKFMNANGISSSLVHDDYGYSMTDLYVLDSVLIGYIAYDVVCDEV